MKILILHFSFFHCFVYFLNIFLSSFYFQHSIHLCIFIIASKSKTFGDWRVPKRMLMWDKDSCLKYCAPSTLYVVTFVRCVWFNTQRVSSAFSNGDLQLTVDTFSLCSCTKLVRTWKTYTQRIWCRDNHKFKRKIESTANVCAQFSVNRIFFGVRTKFLIFILVNFGTK